MLPRQTKSKLSPYIVENSQKFSTNAKKSQKKQKNSEKCEKRRKKFFILVGTTMINITKKVELLCKINKNRRVNKFFLTRLWKTMLKVWKTSDIM